jgi:hypothetical protein
MITQATFVKVAPKLPRIFVRATFTIVVSTISSNAQSTADGDDYSSKAIFY